MSKQAKGSSKTVKAMPPTLLVGLGGTGCEIVGRVYDLASKEQQKSIQFAFLDTDANELRERKLKAPHAHTVQTSRKITVGQALRDDPEAYNNTFPINPQLMNKPLTEGAGQIRAVSKLAFDMCVREGRLGGLHEAINNLQKLSSDDMEQSIRVLIVSTLVGGTGSGILLPVAMYLRNYLENYCNKKPIIRAFCVLPEVFFTDKSKTEVEKSNLRTNAYATLRELDAFMLRADSKPGSDIRSRFTLKMPRPGTVGQYEEYEQNPLDYCFLFDAQNINGETLDSLQAYKIHAAECIYASSISRLHKRLNSSEDNTILERCAENGRNRYCGVGAAKLFYPGEAVRDYVALNWMSQAMTEDWLRYDNKVEAERARRQNSRKRGVSQPPVNERELYCTYVDQDLAGDSKNYFGLAISEETYEVDEEGMLTETPRWETYRKKLDAFIGENSRSDVKDAVTGSLIAAARQKIEEKELDSFKSDFVTIAQKLKVLFIKTHKKVETNAAVIADSLFSVDNFNVEDENRIEHYLLKNGVPVHPNSARFFLYNLEIMLKEELTRLKARKSDSDDTASAENGRRQMSFPELEKKVQQFFTAETYVRDDDESGTKVNIVRYANSLKQKTFRNTDFIDSASDLLDKCDGYIGDIQKYYGMYVRVAIIEKALAFIDDLCNNYEIFYKMLGDEIKGIARNIQRIEESYQNVVGNPVINVCASPTCLQAVLAACPNTIDSVQLTDDFKQSIFEIIYKNSSADAIFKTKQQRQIIENLVSGDILDFWRESVLTQYPRKVDMDIIQALLAEAEYEEGYTSVADLEHYVEQKYNAALTLSAPFIDRPVGQPYQIIACGMSSDIEDVDDAVKCRIMKLFGHYEKDSLMDKNQILVMTALYNLKASDLKKFASADPHPADPRAAGSYFKDYVARIDNILPDSEKSNIITPHLDRRWHFAGVLPDFEDKTEVARQTEAQKAFLVALAYGYVRFNRDQYKFVDGNGDFISEQIIVQDGLCDKLHEVYDALSISRPLVRDFLNRYQTSTDIEKDVDSLGNLDYTHSKLYKALKNMHLLKYPFIPTVSYLEIPLLYKTSVGNGSFDDDDAVTMLHNFINMTDEYLSIFYDDNIRRTDYLVRWLDEQTALMLDNVAQYYNLEGKVIIQEPFADLLLARLVNNILGKFRNLSSANEEAAKCCEKYTAKWSELTKA
ncbi:MAG: hypothetical protein IJ518_00460 [Clostridia bacterium]|nr:hypothetical protein [Clostridia bacterium]